MRLVQRTLPFICCVGLLASCGGASDVAPDSDPANDVTDVSLEPLAEVTTTTIARSDRPTVEPPAALPTELVIDDIAIGTGRVAVEGDTVWVDYTGVRSADGVEFDNSYDRGEPITFTLGTGAVIDGWDQGILGAQAGTIRRLDIPADLAYGDSSPGGVIQAGDALTFVVEVRAVVPASTEADIPDIDPAAYPPVAEVTIDDLTTGDGHEIAIGDSAITHVMIARADTAEIEFETWSGGQPTLIEVIEGYSIPGLFEGLIGMRVGGIRAISMPADAAFGSEGVPELEIPPDTPMLVVVELVGAF